MTFKDVRQKEPPKFAKDAVEALNRSTTRVIDIGAVPGLEGAIQERAKLREWWRGIVVDGDLPLAVVPLIPGTPRDRVLSLALAHLSRARADDHAARQGRQRRFPR
jgi:hypothetical protein